MHCATRPSDSGSAVLHAARQRFRLALNAIAACCLAASLSGCAALTQPIEGVPADRLPADFFPEGKNELVPVDISLLSIEPPRDYQLGAGDILGVYVDGILPYSQPNSPPQPPPVNFPGAESSLPPSIGYPIAVQDDGTLSLPLLEPISVEGLTLDQVRDAIRDAYIKEEILRPDKARPIVTIIRERTYNVVVIREDAAQAGANGASPRDYSASGSTINLPAYKNDILHALVQTGGLPGLGAKNEILILRASKADKRKREEFMRTFYAYREAAQLDPCACLPQLPDDPTILRIPLRVKPGVVPALDEEDVTLEDGDIVYIESREREVFYTGGLLGGGEFPLPRDYDLDVLGAMAMSGQLYQTGQQGMGQGGGGFGGGMGGMGGLQGVPPGIVYILRKTECDGQIAIEVDLKDAYNNPSARPLIQPGDYVILQYKCEEELINYGLQTFFTFGIADLYRN